MNMRTILFPTDFSTCSDSALKFATSLARDTKAKLLIVHVEEAPLAYGGEMYYGAPEPASRDLDAMLSRISPSDPAVAFERRLLIGDPATEIVELAERENADMIVIGTHGRTGVSRMLLGSVTEAIVRHAKCPVLAVKQPNPSVADNS